MGAGQIQRSRLRAEERRVRVGEMYFRLGMRQTEIAEQVKVSQATVSGDIKILLKRWREATLANIAELRGKELATLAEMERDAALEFQARKDPRFLTERRLIMKRRAEMLGLDAPMRLAGPAGGPLQVQAVPVDLGRLSDEELALLEKILEDQDEEPHNPRLKP